MSSLRLVDRSAVTRENDRTPFVLSTSPMGPVLHSFPPSIRTSASTIPAGVRFAQKTAGNLVTGNPCNSFRINIHGVAPKVMILSNLEER